MSVPKSKRKQTPMQFVHNARVIEGFCIEHWHEKTSCVLKKCIEISAEIYVNVTCANSIYPTTKTEAFERALYLKKALASVYALKVQLSLAYRHNLTSSGVAKELNEYIEREKGLIKGTIKKDKERYKGLPL